MVVVVAAVTLVAKASSVRVGSVMAATAILRDLLLVVTTAMASEAIDLRVGSQQCVSGLLQMIESGGLPLVGVVAIATSLAARATMYVVRRVTAIAALRSRRIATPDVTGIARQLLVRSRQHEARAGMIEARVAPALERMTLATWLLELLVVYVVAPVALAACDRGFPPGFARRVTLAAGLRRVNPLQRKLGQRMIELCCIQLDDVRITPLVFTVTGPTLAAARIGHAPMVAMVRLNVLIDVLMAVRAQDRLRTRVAAVVAIGAMLFLLHVCLGNLPGHQQRLDRRGAACGNRE